MKTTRIFFFAAAAALLAGPAFGGIIVQDLGSAGSAGTVDVWRAATWTQTGTYSSVTIGADLATNGISQGNGTAYLMTQLGPGTTIADEVASFSIVNLPTSCCALNTMTPLFSGLTLGPGTYFLLIDPQTTLYWTVASSPSQTLGSGVTQGSDVALSGSRDPGFPPDSPYAATAYNAIFSVSGTPVTGGSTPEPSTIVMFLSGLAGIGIALRKRRIA
ncbi:MAG: PEP-CTERM sorting domain-containing protein [Bryobacteraceae bacterium]|jgi:hypothetical protein